MCLLCKTEIKRKKGRSGFVTTGKANTGLLLLLCFFQQHPILTWAQLFSIFIYSGYLWGNQSKISMALPISLLHRRGRTNGACTTVIRKDQVIPVSLLRKRLQLPTCRRSAWAVTLPSWSHTPICRVQITSSLPFPAGVNTGSEIPTPGLCWETLLLCYSVLKHLPFILSLHQIMSAKTAFLWAVSDLITEQRLDYLH